jgi:hypothetical protein
MKSRLYRISRYLWLILVTGFVIVYWRQDLSQVSDRWREISWLQVTLSLASLLLGKLLLAESARWSLTTESRFSLRQMFGLYSLSQLGKYLPGGVWHFFGRAALYQAEGVPAKAAARAILVENSWLLGSALFLGAVAGWPQWIGAHVTSGGWDVSLWTAGGMIAIAVLWLLVLLGAARAAGADLAGSHKALLKVAFCQAGVWFLLGLSFWSLLPHGQRTQDTLPLAVSSFALGWAAGYLAPFAPAGLGVREAVIVTLLAPSVSLGDALLAVGFSRVVWTLTELVLGLVGHFSIRFHPTPAPET